MPPHLRIVPPLLLTDADVEQLPATDVVSAIRDAIQLHANGRLTAPPRAIVRTERGQWAFTVGGVADEVFGFRAYGVGTSADDDQLVAVWNAEHLEAIVVGSTLGERRTAGIAAVATDLLARADARTLGVVGSGRQARAHIREVQGVRRLEHVRVYSRDEEHRELTASWVSDEFGIDATPVPTAEEAARGADLVTLATTSQRPVIDPQSIDAGTHVTTLGPKFASRHELPLEVARDASLIVTDSLAQVAASPSPFFLQGTPAGDRMHELGSLLGGEKLRQKDDITLFCSVGLSGTEPILARALARHVTP